MPSGLTAVFNKHASSVPDSVDVRLRDGRDRCAGRLEIKYEGAWQRVPEQGWTDDNSNAVCRQLGCGGGRRAGQEFPQGTSAFLATAVSCSKAENIAECITSSKNTGGKSAVMLICDGKSLQVSVHSSSV